MRPAHEIQSALALLAYIIDKAPESEPRLDLEHAAFALRWVLGLPSPLEQVVRDLGTKKPRRTSGASRVAH